MAHIIWARFYDRPFNLNDLRERLTEKRARVQQIVKEAAELDNIVQSDTQSKLNLLGSFCNFGESSETYI